jgi:hypothetical protein
LQRKQRLDYANLAEVLRQRNLVDRGRLSLALQTSTQSRIPFPEVLVTDKLIGDWDLSRVVADLYSLPFVPVDIYPPNETALDGLDHDYLRKHRLIPVDRFGDLLTVCMPAIVPADVLGTLAARNNLQVLPMVGTVVTNNHWFEANLAAEVPGPLPRGSVTDWSEIFDEGDARVLMDLTPDLDEVERQADFSPGDRDPAGPEGYPPR